MLYDPIRKREVTVENGLARVLRQEYEPELPMGNFGMWALSDVISAWLVGLHEEIASAIPRALQWIDLAIDHDEKFGPDPNGHRVTLHWARAIGGWLAEEGAYESDWDAASVFQVGRWGFEQRPWSVNEIVKSGLDDYMAFALQGNSQREGLEAAIDTYEKWTGKSGVALGRVSRPRDFGYALCLHRAGRQPFNEDDLFKAGRRMLRANLESTWLGNGQYIRAATWLKIVHWREGGALSPLQVVLRAYDDMPKVPRPDFLPAG